MTPEQAQALMTKTLREIEETEALLPGTLLACRYGTDHAEYCFCGGSGLTTREERLKDLEFDLAIPAHYFSRRIVGMEPDEKIRSLERELALTGLKLARAIDILKDLAGDYGVGSAVRNTIFDFLES